MTEYRNKRVLVLGATGLLGSAVVRKLEAWGAVYSRASRSLGCDVRDRSVLAKKFAQGFDLVVNCAGENGGLGYNLARSGHCLINNTQVAVNAVEACVSAGVPFIGAVASCAYPDQYPQPLREEWYLEGSPHPSVACHGLAKRSMVLACKYAREENPAAQCVTVCIPTLFGVGDSFDPLKTKVVGAMVRRFADAVDGGVECVTCWGTGKPLREILYADDAAELMLRAAPVWDDSSKPLNLSYGQEYSVRDLSEIIAASAGYQGEIVWDSSRGDGQYRKALDTTRMKSLGLGGEPTRLSDALRATIDDYRRRKALGEFK